MRGHEQVDGVKSDLMGLRGDRFSSAELPVRNRWSSSLLAALTLLSGCSEPDGSVPRPVPSACKIYGNVADSSVCQTAFSSVLADPRQFDGVSISIGAWVEPVNDVIMAFPSRDALNLRESSSSVVIYASENPRAVEYLSGLPDADPVYVRVKGVFHWINDAAPRAHFDPVDVGRVGVLEGVELSR